MTGGVSGDVLESFTGMVRQLGAAQEDIMRQMKAEHDAKTVRLLRVMDGMAKKGNIEYDQLAEFRENGV